MKINGLGVTVTSHPCPAILLREHRADVQSWFEDEPDGRSRYLSRTAALDPPYQTSAVFAAFEIGGLYDAADLANYVDTVGPDEDPEMLATPGWAVAAKAAT